MPTATLTLCLFLTGTVFAHDYWIQPVSFSCAAEEELAFTITGGHRYPEAELKLSESLLKNVSLLAPDGSAVTLTTQHDDGLLHTGKVTLPPQAGLYLLRMVIQHPRRDRPQYIAHTIITAGNPENLDLFETGAGNGPEITVKTVPPDVPQDWPLPVSVKIDGKPVAAALTVYPAGRRPLYLNTSADKPALLPFEPGVAYLITANVDRTGLSLLIMPQE